MKILLVLLFIIVVLAILYFSGPKPSIPSLHPQLREARAIELKQLEKEINNLESSIPNIKPDNQARIIWADSGKKEKTLYCVVYVHGFSASAGEGYTVNINFAKRYACNMYMARLAEHGIESSDALLNLTPETYMETAKKAVNIGRQLGDKVILMSTSTGGTLSLAIAAENPWIHSLILYSPNIEVADKTSNIFLKPWGLQIARLIKGNYNEFEESEEIAQYWQLKYRLEGIQAMKVLIRATMNNSTFKKINQPIFLGYYYKNKEEQDGTVSVKRMLEMYEQVSTPEKLKRKIAFPNAGCHPIPSGFYNKNYKSVEIETYRFAEEILGLQPKANSL